MKSKRVILIHGFNVSDGGKGSIDKLIPELKKKGYEPIEFDYGYLELFLVRFRTDFIAKSLLNITKPGDHIIAHSHGCAIAARAMEMRGHFDRVVFIHPALAKDWKIPSRLSLNRLTVFYSDKDYATRAAGWLRKFSPFNWIFGKHIWGSMGTYGPTSRDNRIRSINDKQYHSSIFNYLETHIGKSIFDALN